MADNISTGSGSNKDEDDPFDAFVSAPVTATTEEKNLNKPVVDDEKSLDEESDFFNQKAPKDKKLDKESILKLYENITLPPQQTLNNMNPLGIGPVSQPVISFGQQLPSQGVPVIPQSSLFMPSNPLQTQMPHQV